VIFKLSDSKPLHGHACSYFYSLWDMHTNICLDMCDLKISHPVNKLLLILDNWVYIHIIYRRWICVI